MGVRKSFRVGAIQHDGYLPATLGMIDEMSTVHKFGQVTFDSVDEDYTLWPGAQDGFEIRPYLTAATQVDVSSSSANDDLAGTGARKVVIQGLDSNYLEITETIELDGQNRVTSTNSYIRLYRAYITEVGVGGVNDGNIWVYDDSETSVVAGVPQTDSYKLSLIPIGLGQTLNGFYTVPADKYMVFHHLRLFMSTAKANAYGSIKFQIRLYNENSTNNYEGWRTNGTFGLDAGGSSAISLDSKHGYLLPPRTDVRLLARSTVLDVAIDARLAGVSVDSTLVE